MKRSTAVKVAGAVLATVIAGAASFKALKSPEKEKLPALLGPDTFTYVGTTDNKEYAGEVHYTDQYFSAPSTEYNPSLSTASLSFAMACGNSPQGFEYGPVNAVKFLSNLGFQDIEYNDSYGERPILESIGVIIGQKQSGDTTLVAVGIRGIGYGSEWGSNLLLGTGEMHQGFDEASERVLVFLEDYLKKYCSGAVKLWICGYSRSAATANLVAGKLDRMCSECCGEILSSGCTLSIVDLYAYCFEPPLTVMESTCDIHGPLYENIWNIVNPNDPIPILVMSYFGMGRFGTDVLLPCKGDSEYEVCRDQMLKYYESLPNRREIGHYRADRFELTNMSALLSRMSSNDCGYTQVEFLNEFNRRFSKCIGSREHYQDTIQSGFSKYIAERWADEDELTFRRALPSCIAAHMVDFATAILCLATDDYEGVKIFLKAPVHEALEKCNALQLTEDEVLGAIAETLSLFKEFILDNKLLFFNFVIHSKGIFTAHYPELIFAWMMSLDPTYNSSILEQSDQK